VVKDREGGENSLPWRKIAVAVKIVRKFQRWRKRSRLWLLAIYKFAAKISKVTLKSQL
jgi:hypothetical protein